MIGPFYMLSEHKNKVDCLHPWPVLFSRSGFIYRAAVLYYHRSSSESFCHKPDTLTANCAKSVIG